MAPTTKQVRLPFDKMTESGLKPIVKKIERWGVKISKIESTNQPRRESGFLLKDVTFVFDDGQKMLVKAKSDGTIFQVKLGTRVVPIKSVDNLDKAIIEMVDYVQENARAYARAKIQKEKRKRLNIAPPSVITSRQEKIAAANSSLAAVQSSVAELEQQHGGIKESLALKNSELQSVEADIVAEQTKTKELEAELEALKKAA